MTEKEKTTKKTTRTPQKKRSAESVRSSQKTPKEPMSRDEVRKQQNEIRRKKHRRNKIILYCVIAVLIVAVGVVLSLTVFFKTETISVAGDEIYNNETIISASGIKTGDNMFLFDKDNVAQTIETSLPYVEKAEIKRGITGTVTIVVTAAKATLALDLGDSYTLVNSSGKVLEDGAMLINDDITIINASNVLSAQPGQKLTFENENDLNTIVGIQKLIEKYEINGVNMIDVTDPSDVKLMYAQRVEIEIGSASEFEAKIDFVKATIQKQNIDEPLFEGTIDFRIENKAYINPKEETTAAAVPVTVPEMTIAA